MPHEELSERYAAARALFTAGRHQEALQTIQALLWEYPGHADLIVSKALCLEALGRGSEAASLLREALEAGTENASLRNTLERLEKDVPDGGAAPGAPPIDPVALLKRLEALEAPEASPLAFLTGPRVYLVVFLLMFLLLTLVGPMIWWTLTGQ